jgi:hypothetical protein
VNDVHLLLNDVSLPVRFIRLAAPEDHGAALGLRELFVFFLSAVRWVAGRLQEML